MYNQLCIHLTMHNVVHRYNQLCMFLYMPQAAPLGGFWVAPPGCFGRRKSSPAGAAGLGIVRVWRSVSPGRAWDLVRIDRVHALALVIGDRQLDQGVCEQAFRAAQPLVLHGLAVDEKAVAQAVAGRFRFVQLNGHFDVRQAWVLRSHDRVLVRGWYPMQCEHAGAGDLGGGWFEGSRVRDP